MKMSKRLLALGLVAAMALTGCSNSKPADGGNTNTDGGNTNTDGGNTATTEGIKDLVTWETSNRELETKFILNSESASDLNVLANTNSGLLETNAKGQLVAAAAKEWGTEDGGLTWTFKLRDDVKWVDVNGEVKADCTSADWITGLEWILNAAKNEGCNNLSMPSTMIKGAEDYYNFTKEMVDAGKAEEAKALGTDKFLEMVGIEAPDAYTLIYHCTSNCSYFDTVCTSACLYSVSQEWIDTVGLDNVTSVDFPEFWYNGAYTVTEFISGNTKTLTKNPNYWDTECTLFDTVTVKIIEDTVVGYNLYDAGEIDHIDLSEATLRTIYDDASNKYHDQLVEKLPRKYSYQFHFNYDKYNEDGTVDTNWNTAIANENFRLALYYGLDLTRYWARTNFIYPEHCENLAYTMKGLLYTSDGTEYTELVKEGLTLNAEGGRYNKELATEYMNKAIEELTAKGVTFPVEADYWIIAGSQTALDGSVVMKEIFEDLGDGQFITLNTNTYVTSLSQEVRNPHLQSFVINGWGADYGDIQNYLGQETIGEDTAYYANYYSNINKATDPDLIATYTEFTRLVNEADAITDNLDNRYKAYAVAEQYMLNHGLSIPAQLEVSWELTKVNDYSRSNAMYGIDNYQYKNWQTSTEPYTTEQYAKFAEEYNN